MPDPPPSTTTTSSGCRPRPGCGSPSGSGRWCSGISFYAALGPVAGLLARARPGPAALGAAAPQRRASWRSTGGDLVAGPARMPVTALGPGAGAHRGGVPTAARPGVGPGRLPPDPRVGAGGRTRRRRRPGRPDALLVRGLPPARRAGRRHRGGARQPADAGRRLPPDHPRAAAAQVVAHLSPTRRVSRWLTMLPATAPDSSGPSVVRLRPAPRISRLRTDRFAALPSERRSAPGCERVDAAPLGPGHHVGLHLRRRRARHGRAVDLVQLGDQLDLDGRHEQRLGGELHRSGEEDGRRGELHGREGTAGGTDCCRTPWPRRRSGPRRGRRRRAPGAGRAASPGCAPGSAARCRPAGRPARRPRAPRPARPSWPTPTSARVRASQVRAVLALRRSPAVAPLRLDSGPADQPAHERADAPGALARRAGSGASSSGCSRGLRRRTPCRSAARSSRRRAGCGGAPGSIASR